MIANSDQTTAKKLAKDKKVTVTCTSGYALTPADKTENPSTTTDLTCTNGALVASAGTVPTACDKGSRLLRN